MLATTMEHHKPDMEPQLQGAPRHRHPQLLQLQLPPGLVSRAWLRSTRTISPAMEEAKYARNQLLLTARRAHSPTEHLVNVRVQSDACPGPVRVVRSFSDFVFWICTKGCISHTFYCSVSEQYLLFSKVIKLFPFLCCYSDKYNPII